MEYNLTRIKGWTYIYTLDSLTVILHFCMCCIGLHFTTQTSCAGNSFSITGSAWRESAGHLLMLLTRYQWCLALMFPLPSAQTSCAMNTRDVLDLGNTQIWRHCTVINNTNIVFLTATKLNNAQYSTIILSRQNHSHMIHSRGKIILIEYVTDNKYCYKLVGYI